MTDKQIIIDGIDVSKCEFLIINNDKQLCRCIKSDLFGGIEFVENAKNGNCKDNPNCYYKQLKRKEQECEELKAEAKKQKEIAKEYEQRWLKTLMEFRKDNMSEYCKKCYELQEQLDQLKAENEELKKKIKYMEEYIKTVENSRNEFEKESKFLKEEIQKL